MIVKMMCAFLCVAAVMDAPARRRFVISTLAEYSPSSYHIVRALERATAGDASARRIIRWEPLRDAAFAGDPDEVAMALAFNAVVHEACHEYAAGAGAGSLLLFTGTSDRRVRMAAIFPVKEVRAAVPSRFRGRAFGTYASGPAADERGIYALLEEFVSHYHGARVAHDMLRWYGSRHAGNGRTWASFTGSVDSSIDAGLELKLYLLCYLRYAKSNHPETYNSVVNDAGFRIAFCEIERNRRILADRHFDGRVFLSLVRGRGRTDAELRPKGKSEYILLRENGKAVWIAVPRPSNRYNGILKELSNGAYDEVLRDLGR